MLNSFKTKTYHHYHIHSHNNFQCSLSYISGYYRIIAQRFSTFRNKLKMCIYSGKRHLPTHEQFNVPYAYVYKSDSDELWIGVMQICLIPKKIENTIIALDIKLLS